MVLVLSFCAPAEGRESGAGGQLQLLRLDDGALLPGFRDSEPLLWQTAFGMLEISPERLLLITELSDFKARRTISPRPFRLRLSDGELKVGWPLTVDPDGMSLELEMGGEAAVLLEDVLEVNDLPRSGPGGLAPMPRRGVYLAWTAQTGPASATPTPTQSESASIRRERRLAAARKALSRRTADWKRPGVSTTGRFKQFGLGYCGLGLGAVVGALIGGGVGRGGEDGLVAGLLIGAPLGAATAIYSTGESSGGKGSFLATLVGSFLGVAVGAGLAKGNDSLIVIAPLLPLVGGMLGYVVTDETARK